MKPKRAVQTEKDGFTTEEQNRLRPLEQTLLGTRPDADLSRVRQAYHMLTNCAAKADSKSLTGQTEDALSTAQILAEVHADEDTIIAALVHPLMEKKCLSQEDILQHFGNEVSTLIEKVDRTSHIRFKSRIEQQAENFRKMILAMAQDLRVVLLSLAKRLQLMRTLSKYDPTTQMETALESIEIYAPLANRLGIARIKWEMEDLCLKVLNPSIYGQLEESVPQDRKQRKAYIDKVIRIFKKEMKNHGIPGQVEGRPKHFYSIYQKIVKRGVSFEEIFDLTALRIITDTTNHCYAILGLIHSLWKPITGRFKDFIGVPKSNMYQSLHTTVVGPEGQRVEFQIRTEEMHRVAEHGIAAHWKYKEGVADSLSLEQKFAWLRQLLEWQQELKSPREFLESVKTDLFEEAVYVFTPAGDVVELPAGSTPLDFAYSIHSDVGNQCTGAKVNNRMVPLKTTLKTGDALEILTSKKQVPSKDWLKLVKSTKARSRIRHYLNQEEQKRSLSLGNEILEKEARRHGLSLSKIMKSDKVHEIVGELGFSQVEKMIASVGFGKISAHQILNRFLPQEALVEPGTVRQRKVEKKARDGIKISGVRDILVHFSRCCTPVPGDDIIGFITRGKGVSIHRMDCANVGGGSINSDRLVDVEWDFKEESVRAVRISVLTLNRPGILANISAKISTGNINISAADIRTNRDGRSTCILELEIRNRQDLDRIVQAISEIRDVLEVKRISGL